MKILLELFFIFFKSSILTYGGGYVMFNIFKKELSEKRNWMKEEELLDFYGISSCTPGIIAANVATFVGYRLKGVAGAIVATMGVVSTSIILISFVSWFALQYINEPIFVSALKGVKIAVVAILLNFMWELGRKELKDIKSFIILAVAAILLLYFKLHIILIILTCGTLGWLLRRKT